MAGIKSIGIETIAHFPMIDAPKSVMYLEIGRAALSFSLHLSHHDPRYFRGPIRSYTQADSFDFIPEIFIEAFRKIAEMIEDVLNHLRVPYRKGPDQKLTIFYEDGSKIEYQRDGFFLEPDALENALRGYVPPQVLHNIFHQTVAVDAELKPGGRFC